MDWVVPSLGDELGEFERVAKTFGVQLTSLISLFRNGTVEEMDEETWSQLENTQSRSRTELWQVFEAAANSGRDAQGLLDAFRAGKPMQAPIVLFLADGSAHLVSGNTRLMMCRALGERPKVFKLHSTILPEAPE